MLNITQIVYFVYAAILLGGGFMGSQVSGKSSSLIGSGIFAAVSVAAGVLVGRAPVSGLTLGGVNALAVAGFFLYRYLGSETRKFMPAIPSIILSLLVLFLTIAAFSSAQKASGK